MRITKFIFASASIAIISSGALAQQALTGSITMVDEANGKITIQLTQGGTVGANTAGGTDEFKDTAVMAITTDKRPDDSDADFTEKITDLPLSDAKKFLERLEEEGIQFKLVSLDSKMWEMDVFIASVGGSFGAATTVRIFTRLDDDMRVEKIWREFCNFDDSDA